MLVELMTGLLIGLMTTLTALGTLAFLQAGASLHGESFRLQQRVQVALQTIEQQVRQAGAVELQMAPDGQSVRFSRVFDGYGGSGHAVFGQDGANGAPDTLQVSHQDGAQTRDCLGNQPDDAQAGVRVDSQFSVAAGALRCLGAHRSTGNQTIVERVEDFQVMYGLQTNTALGPRFRYVDATAVGSAWPSVRAVRVCLQVAGERSLGVPAATDRIDCQGRKLREDGLMRRVAHATYTLRNLPI